MIGAVEAVLARAGAEAGDGRGLRPRDDRRHQRAARGTRRPHGADRDPRASPTCSRSAARTGPTSTGSARRSRRRWSSRSCASRRPSGSGPRAWSSRSPRASRSAWRSCCARAAPSRSRSACSSPTSTPATSGASPSTCASELPGLHVSASHEVLPRFREYERCSTTAIDAYLSPLLGRYLGRLGEAAAAAGLPQPLVMQSSGGVARGRGGGAGRRLERPLRARRRRGRRRPARPRSAATATRSASTWAAPPATSAWSRTARCGAPTRAQIGGRAIQLPMVDVHTVGAGGGSIGWRDRGGALRVGPRSAGAEPGPACYGRGGSEPTVTDANLLLGHLAADSTPGRRRRRSTSRRPSARSAALADGARPRPARDRRGDRPGRQPGDGAGAARGHGRARRRPAPLRPAALRRRRADARGGDRRRARHRAHPLPARRRRALGARPLRLGPPPRHRPHGDAQRRRAERRADRRRGRRADRAARRRPRGRRARGGLRDALRRPGLRAAGARARPTPTRPTSPSASSAPTRSATATATPTARSCSSTSAWRWSSPGPRPRPAAAAAGDLERERPPGALRRRVGRDAGPARRARRPAPSAEGPVVFELPEATFVLPPGWSAEVDDAGTIVERFKTDAMRAKGTAP